MFKRIMCSSFKQIQTTTFYFQQGNQQSIWNKIIINISKDKDTINDKIITGFVFVHLHLCAQLSLVIA